MSELQDVGCHKLIRMRVYDGVYRKPDAIRNQDVAVTVTGAWAQNPSLCMRPLKVQHTVATLQINQQRNGCDECDGTVWS